MLTTELCAHLSADFNLQIPDKPACFTCTHAALDQWEDTEKRNDSGWQFFKDPSGPVLFIV